MPFKLLLVLYCKNHEDKLFAECVRQLAQIDSDLINERESNR